MSRSNPNEASQHPCTRWMEWDGANGSLRYYDKEKKENVDLGNKFTFILLDQLSVIKGWHDASESGITSNEVKDTRRDPFVVRAFKGKGTLAEGIYAQIKDRVGSIGGHFTVNLYVAFRSGNDLLMGSLMLKGSALREWSEFRNANRNLLYSKAVTIDGYTEGKKGKVVFRSPKFSLRDITEETNKAATALDVQLQEYLASYLKKPVVEQSQRESEPDSGAPEVEGGNNPFNAQEPDIDSDIPF